jgi:hypothetical protein
MIQEYPDVSPRNGERKEGAADLGYRDPCIYLSGSF